MQKSRHTLIAAVLLAAAISACSNDDSPTRGSVCRELAPAACTYAIRCEAWEGTQEDCERVQMHECCERDGACGDEVAVDSDLLETCLATIRGATCGSNPTGSEVCRDAVTVPSMPAADAGTDAGSDVDAFVPPADAGAPSRLYARCPGGEGCGASETCYTLTYGTTDFACSMPCTGPDDTSCPAGHCVRTRTAPYGETPADGTAVCLESCTTAADCTIAGWQCLMTATGFRVCLP